jgi:hypothetical protein
MYLLPYLLIKNRLKEIAEIGMIDFDLGQDTPRYKGGVRKTPAVFISFRPVNTNSLGKSEQMGQMEFDVRLVTSVSNADDKRLTENRPVNHFALMEAINNKLHKFRMRLGQLPNFADYGAEDMQVTGSIQRILIDPNDGNSSLMRNTQRYSCTVKEISGNTIYQKILADFEPELSSELPECHPATAIIEDQNGVELKREQIASGAKKTITVNTNGGGGASSFDLFINVDGENEHTDIIDEETTIDINLTFEQ